MNENERRNWKGQAFTELTEEKLAQAKKIFTDIEKKVKDGIADDFEMYMYRQVMVISQKNGYEAWKFNIAWLEVLSMGSKGENPIDLDETMRFIDIELVYLILERWGFDPEVAKDMGILA